MKGKPKNVQGLIFKEQEAGYLAGYLAGPVGKGQQRQGGLDRRRPEDPAGRPLHRRLPGRREEGLPGVETLNGYSQDFVDQAKCKEIALDQIAKGSKVVFQVAGQCGLGALDAAKEKGVQGIGVDNDQSFLGDHILTSALKKVDEAVFEAIKRAQDGTFKGGTDVVATVENGGVGIGKISAEGAEVRRPDQGDRGS